jgi:hypothetical protein
MEIITEILLTETDFLLDEKVKNLMYAPANNLLDKRKNQKSSDFRR